MKMLTRAAIYSFLILLLAPRALMGQATASGTVLGTISDTSQAVVNGAEVTITSVATGTARTMVTNNVGSYRFDLLSAGSYKLTVKSKGFATAVQTIELLVGQTATANLALTPGATSQTIEVAGSNPMVDLQKTSVSAEITPTEVQNLPMVGRDVANLAYLAPGVKATDSYDPTKNRYAILSVNGEGGRNVNVTVNGVDNKDNTVGGPVMQLPLEAVEEYHISTQRFSAENGRSEGAAINMITKSRHQPVPRIGIRLLPRHQPGHRRERLPTGTGGQISAHPDYTRQQFGGSIGGPIKKDKRLRLFRSSSVSASTRVCLKITTSYAQLVAAKGARTCGEPGRIDSKALL